MSEVGSITVKIGADTYELQKGVAGAKKELDSLGTKGDALAGVLQGLATVAIATAGAFTILSKNTLNAMDALDDVSQKTGVAVESLSKLGYVANIEGIGITGLQQAFVFLTRGMSEAAQGAGNALPAFNALGVQFKNNDGTLRSADELFADIADKFAGMKDSSEKTALAIGIFGRAGAQLIPMLNYGSAGLKEMSDELESFGGVVTPKAAAEAAKFNDNLSRMSMILSSISMRTFSPLLEGLNASFDAFMKTDKAARGFMAFMGSFSLSGLDTKEPNLALAQTESTIAGVRRNIEALQKYPVLNADDLAIANKQLEFLEAKSRAIQNVIASNTQAPEAEKINAPVLGDADATTKAQEKENAFKVEQAKKLQMMLEGMMTERQLEQERFRQQLEDLEIARHALGISTLDSQMWVEQLENEHWERMNEIRKKGLTEAQKFTEMSYKDQAKTILGQMAAMTASVANQSKELFEINKAVAIANSIINTYEGINKTLAAYPYPISAVMAAAQGAMGFANVASIASQQFNGKGTTAPSVASSVPAGVVPTANVGTNAQSMGGGAGQVVNISLTGSTFNRDQVRDLITNINEVISDGSTIRLQ